MQPPPADPKTHLPTTRSFRPIISSLMEDKRVNRAESTCLDICYPLILGCLWHYPPKFGEGKAEDVKTRPCALPGTDRGADYQN